MISVAVKSALIMNNKLKFKFHFPYGATDHTCPGYDFTKPDEHKTFIVNNKENEITLDRQLDTTRYFVKIAWEQLAVIENPQPHKYLLIPSDSDSTFTFSCLFSKEKYQNTLPDFSETKQNSREAWEKFWMSGGAVDFSECTDPRAVELERRAVLSQYLTKIQSSGSLPPQETGLTFNSWYGKFHLEMHWWHVAHFIAWNRPNLMEEQLNYYTRIIEKAKQTAQHQAYNGVRWPKMTDFSGTESPSTVGTFLIWQQPHVIYFTEMLYQLNLKTEVLDKYKDLVFDTADFMASYARWDSSTHRYVLGPALIPAQEVFAPETTINPPFELAYWYWGLQTAQKWRKRLGMKENPLYRNVLENISPLPKNDSLYIFAENRPDSYHNPDCLRDHPIVLGAYGFVPHTPLVNTQLFEKTLYKVVSLWNWDKTWGWDYPLAAMAATRLNNPDLAIDMLLKDVQKNTYLINGHNYQDQRLRIYLPGNGGLLFAIALMCDKSGFPKDGKWNVKWENMGKMP